VAGNNVTGPPSGQNLTFHLSRQIYAHGAGWFVVRDWSSQSEKPHLADHLRAVVVFRAWNVGRALGDKSASFWADKTYDSGLSTFASDGAADEVAQTCTMGKRESCTLTSAQAKKQRSCLFGPSKAARRDTGAGHRGGNSAASAPTFRTMLAARVFLKQHGLCFFVRVIPLQRTPQFLDVEWGGRLRLPYRE